MNKGCKSGFVLDSLDFLKNSGAVDQNCWEGVKGNQAEGKCPVETLTSECKRYKISDYCVMKHGNENLQREILENGPVVGLM